MEKSEAGDFFSKVDDHTVRSICNDEVLLGDGLVSYTGEDGTAVSYDVVKEGSDITLLIPKYDGLDIKAAAMARQRIEWALEYMGFNVLYRNLVS